MSTFIILSWPQRSSSSAVCSDIKMLHSWAFCQCLFGVNACLPFSQIDIIRAMVIVWRVRGKIVRSVLCNIYYVQQLWTMQCIHIWTDLAVCWIGFSLTGPISLRVDSFLCMYVFCVSLYIACSSCIVTWWGGPGRTEAWSLGHYFLQCFGTVGWVIWPIKTRPQYDL